MRRQADVPVSVDFALYSKALAYAERKKMSIVEAVNVLLMKALSAAGYL